MASFEAKIQILIDGASVRAKQKEWAIGQVYLHDALDLSVESYGEDSAESLAIHVKLGEIMIAMSKEGPESSKRSSLDAACESFASAKKIVFAGRRNLFSAKQVEKITTSYAECLFAKGEFFFALKTFKEALQMLEHTYFSLNQAKLNFSISLCHEQLGTHLEALKHCEISVSMCARLLKRNPVDDEIHSLSSLAQEKVEVLSAVVEKRKKPRVWVEGVLKEEPAAFASKKRRLEDAMTLNNV